MDATSVSRIRFVVFGAAGLICASYSVLAVLNDRPDPFTGWLPGIAGICAALLVWISARLAGTKNAGIAHDEFYKIEWGQAVRFSYWFAIALYPLFGVFLALSWVTPITAFAAMGTASGAAPMLAFCVITLRN